MRDIRSDLQERLSEIAKALERLEKALAALDAEETMTNSLLHREEERWALAERGPDVAPLFPPSTPRQYQDDGRYSSPIARFVLRTLAEKGPLDLWDLKIEARRSGIAFGRKNPGRSLHFLLMGMQQTGRVDKDGGKWRLKETKEDSQGKNESGQ
jgi:hypothetical protein